MRVLLFGGTIEGRRIAEAIASSGAGAEDERQPSVECCHVCVATQYGASLLPHDDRIIVHDERMDAEGMAELIRDTGFDICIDATHPYAVAVSENIRTACNVCGLRLYRLLREDVSGKRDNRSGDGIRYYDSVHDAVEYLKDTKGNILTSTGSKELSEFTAISDYSTRVYARVLPTGNVVASCEEMGFGARNLICMQGPFSVEMNIAMINECRAAYVVTKASGNAGGFTEKYEAALKTGAELIVIGRPKEAAEKVYSLEEIYDVLGLNYEEAQKSYVNSNGIDIKEDTDRSGKRRVYLIGTGCGDTGLLTIDAVRAIRECACLIGAGRMIENLKKADADLTDGKEIFISYDPEEIRDYLDRIKPEPAAVLYSGDIGFYSGASAIGEVLNGYETVRIPGISSGTYFCDRLGIAWQDVRFLSCHGRKLDLKRELTDGDKILILLGTDKDAGRINEELCKLDRGRARIYIGERLSYEDEKITAGTAEELRDITTDPLAVMLIINEDKYI